VLDSTFSSVLEAAIGRWEVPAAVVATSVGGERETLAVGCAEDTAFRIASITKPFTATLALSLLALDAQAGTWPDVLVRHLLSHTSGYDCECGDLARFGDGDDALDQAVAELPSVRRWLPPDTVWSYSNAGYWLAGALCARAFGGTYEDAVATLVLREAGLEATSFGEPDLGAVGLDARDEPYPRARRPSGGLVSTAADLVRFGEWQLAQPRTAALRAVVGKPIAGVYGLGFSGERVGGADVWGHGGSYRGFQSTFLLVPSRDAVFVGLTNSGKGGQALLEVEDEWFDRVLGARRRKAPTFELPPADLEAFAGMYANGELRVTMRVEDASLALTAVSFDLATGEQLATFELQSRPVGPRTFEIVGGDFDGDRFDLPLPGLARFGGRLAERVA
jgi:CubicO group peptidase (beta-lactamase class C family)